MTKFKMMTNEMWNAIEDKVEEYALSLVPDSICPACDCLELSHEKDCPNCGYGQR